MGIVYERTGQSVGAIAAYRRAYRLSSDCYPAVLGLIRLMEETAQTQELLQVFQDLVLQFPDNGTIKRLLGLIYYQNRDWIRAEPVIRETLRQNPRDEEFLLMYARTLLEQKRYFDAAGPLNAAAAINPKNPLYLFLRGRLYAEGYHNHDRALGYIRPLLDAPDLSDEIAAYAAGLLLESGKVAEWQEGAELLRRLLESPSPSPAVIDAAFRDALRREDWVLAKSYLLRVPSDSRYMLNAYAVERGLGNKEAALEYARELYTKEPHDEGIIVYVSALIDNGRREEAEKLIESRLADLRGGGIKAAYYYQRSRIQRNEEARLSDLRACLFEDPQNVDALLEFLELYYRRGDERRAAYYYKQVSSFNPIHPKLRGYEKLAGT
jgi:predicted Zn-dependent protease